MAGWRSPTVALLAAAGLWGVAVTGTKYALGGFDPVTLLSIELMAGAGVLWAALLIRGYRPPGSWWLPALLGLLEPALAYLGDTFGLSLTSAVHGAVINGLESGLVVVLAAVLLRETITRPAILAVVAALAGLAVLAGAGAGGSSATGDLLVAGGVLSASFYTIVAKRFDDGSDALSLTAWQFTVATLVSLLVDSAGSASLLADRRTRRRRRLRRQFPAFQYGDRSGRCRTRGHLAQPHSDIRCRERGDLSP
jgi:O-acetylserine/cysteine efflux transporter